MSSLSRKGQRGLNKERLLLALKKENILVSSKNEVCFGNFDIIQEIFVNTSPEMFLSNFIKASLIKGHYSSNKGYQIESLAK